jgi:hypothetical protein
MPKSKLYVAFACLFLALSTTPGGQQVPQKLLGLWQIAGDEAIATGFITNLDCKNHGHVNYFALVEGKSVGGRWNEAGDISCKELKVGQQIAVYYERAKPTNNFALKSAGDMDRPTKELWQTLSSWTPFVLIGPLFLTVLASFFLRVSNKSGFS